MHVNGLMKWIAAYVLVLLASSVYAQHPKDDIKQNIRPILDHNSGNLPQHHKVSNLSISRTTADTVRITYYRKRISISPVRCWMRLTRLVN